MEKPTGSAHMNLGVGTLVALGGAMGYAKKKSVPSLVAGAALGGGLIYSGVMINSSKEYEGHVLGSGVSMLMAGGMGARFLKTKAFMPAGMVALLGSVAAAYNVNKALEWRD